MQVKKQQLELHMQQWTGSKLGKEYVKAVYCHPAYFTYMQSSFQFSCSVVSNSLESHALQQARLQQYVNRELPDVQAGFRKARGTRDKIANISWIFEKNKRVPEKHLFLLY